MVEMSARIQDPHIKKTVTRKVSSKTAWRIVWIVILVLLIAAGGYFYYRFSLYGKEKAKQLVSEGVRAEQSLHFSEALQKYDTALALESVAEQTAAEAAFHAARIHTEKGQHQRAQEYLEQAVDLDPANSAYSDALARSLLATRDIEGAKKVLEDAAERNADDPTILAAQTQVALYEQDEKTADERITRVLTLTPEHPEANFWKGVSVIHENPAQAQDHFDVVLKGQNAGLVDLAKELNEIAQQIASDLGNEAYEAVLVGVALLNNSLPDAALLQLKTAIDADGTYRDAWAYKAQAEIATGRLAEAENSIGQALELDPTFGYSHFVAGILRLAQGDSASAAQNVEKAIEFGYDTTEVRLQLAEMQLAAGKKEEAAEALSDALEENESDAELHQALFWLHFDAGDFPRAKKAAETYQKALPRDAQALGLLALAELKLDDRDEALEDAEKALDQNQLQPVALLVKGLANNDRSALIQALDLDSEGHVGQLATEALESQ
jgi:tetratricopeptide (TPR) repeat protein